MNQMDGFRNKLSTITEMTESTLRPSVENPCETSMNATELEVTQRIIDRSAEIRQKMVHEMLAPKFAKTMQKICHKFKVVDEEQKAKLIAIEQDLQTECHRLMQQRVDQLFTETPEIQTMLNEILKITVVLTDRTSITELHLPIQRKAVEKLTTLQSTISETLKHNSSSSMDLEQELKDQEQESNSKRKRLFRKLDAMNRLNPGLVESAD